MHEAYGRKYFAPKDLSEQRCKLVFSSEGVSCTIFSHQMSWSWELLRSAFYYIVSFLRSKFSSETVEVLQFLTHKRCFNLYLKSYLKPMHGILLKRTPSDWSMSNGQVIKIIWFKIDNLINDIHVRPLVECRTAIKIISLLKRDIHQARSPWKIDENRMPQQSSNGM